MIDIIINIFGWIVNAIQDILQLIVAIPKYTAQAINWINLIIPDELLALFLLMFSAYVVIHIKRLVF